MFCHIQRLKVPVITFASLLIFGCATSLKPSPSASLTNDQLIESLRKERIETLYYDSYPTNVKNLMVRPPGVILDLIRAYDGGGDDLFRFNIIVILNHRSTLTDPEKAVIVQCLGRALKDAFPWVRTEAVWGLGFLGSSDVIPQIIHLLDDPDENVVNETILTLGKLSGIKNLPGSNQNMSKKDRQEAVEFWKAWWEKKNLETPKT